MKGKMLNTLYILQGSILTGVVVMVLFGDSDSDVSQVRHMRLGHMSEREMDVLRKQGFLCG